MKPTEEQVRKFWEWCGFTHGRLFWHSPDGEDTEELSTEPEITLNNLFEYAVPKLDYAELTTDTVHKDMGDYAYAEVTLDGKSTTSSNEDPALALFWAIWKVMEAN